MARRHATISRVSDHPLSKDRRNPLGGPVVVAGAAGILCCAVVIVLSFLPGARHLPAVVSTVLAVLAIPIVFAALYEFRKRHGRWPARDAQLRVVRQLPAPIKIGLGAVVVAGWLIGLVAIIAGPGGAVSESGGRGVVNNHGVVTVLSDVDYAEAQAANSRRDVGIAMALDAGAVALAAGTRLDR